MAPGLAPDGGELRGPSETNVDLTALAAGHTNVLVRFHYYQAAGELWWQVDDVALHGAVSGGNRDTDGDGLQDWWEAVFFGGGTNAAPGADDDQDLFSNEREFGAGTDPHDPRSRLRIDALSVTGATGVAFDSVSGKLYRLLFATNLASGWTPGTNVVGQGGPMSVGDPAPGFRRFYRLDVVP